MRGRHGTGWDEPLSPGQALGWLTMILSKSPLSPILERLQWDAYQPNAGGCRGDLRAMLTDSHTPPHPRHPLHSPFPWPPRANSSQDSHMVLSVMGIMAWVRSEAPSRRHRASSVTGLPHAANPCESQRVSPPGLVMDGVRGQETTSA